MGREPWTRERILSAIAASASGQYVSARDMTLCAVARRMFGSWAAACREAGFTAASERPGYETCTIPGCDIAVRSRKTPYCEKHYGRLRRNGDPEALISRRTRYITSHGYVQVKCPGHVLSVRGWAYEHRLVLLEKIGPGEHPCHWCRVSVSWDESYPKSASALVADHIDGNKLNNDRDNLVPSCQPCNSRRAEMDRSAAGRRGGLVRQHSRKTAREDGRWPRRQ